jgi:glycosyltransferase involved in cell wall biosynthesis
MMALDGSAYMSPSVAAPLVTVITATFNSSATLKFALQSLLVQKMQDFEAWIVGDGCTDASAAVVASFADPRLHWTNLPQNCGSQGLPNNEGLRRARGRYIAYLGHDDLWFPWHLAELLACLEDRKADLVYSLCARYGPRGALLPGVPPPIGATYADYHVPPSSVLHRRDIVEDCGWWGDSKQLSRPVDDDFMRRVYHAGKRIECCPQLSVLKFPSVYWRAYDPHSAHPQERFWRAMQDDLQTFHRQVFCDSFLALAQARSLNPSVGKAFAYAFRLLGRRLVDLYGQERWPLARMFYWKFQYSLRQRRRLRGLAP